MKFQVGQEVMIVEYKPYETDDKEFRSIYESFVGKRHKILGVHPENATSKDEEPAPYRLDTYHELLNSQGVCWRESELEDPFVAACREALDETTTV